jgi:hypothetical protein
LIYYAAKPFIRATGVAMTTCRGGVINPPPQPQQEVLVDLVSSDDE